MPIFKYKAITNNGKKIESSYEANNSQQVLAMLRQKGYFPINVQEAKKSKAINLNFFDKIRTRDIAVFCRQLYTMLNAGVTIINAIDILRVQTENKKFRQVISEVYEELQKGSTFSESLNKKKIFFPSLLINMVEAGEMSGNLDIIMNRMAVHYEKEEKLNNKVKSAMYYPIILSIIAVVVVVFLLVVVMPTFIGMFSKSGVTLPLPTRILLGISYVLRRFWYLVILAIIGIMFGFKKYIDSDKGRLFIDGLKFKIPIIKRSTTNIVTSRFTRTLSTLMSSGVPLMNALDIVGRIVGNKVVSDGLERTNEELRKGVDLSTPIKNIGVFSPMVISMIKIGEESGSLDEILNKTADYYDDEVETSLQKLTSALEPLMIVFMAIIIGFIVLSIALPMFDMISTIEYL